MATATEGREKETPHRAARAFVVLNPKSGGCDPGEVRSTLERHLSAAGVACEVYEPSPDGPLFERVREAVASGSDLVIAAGGDGTVSAVADALAGTDTPLGIVPLGTANVLAGELGLPTDLDDACRGLAGGYSVVRVDAMEVAGRHYVTQVGVGLDAEMIRETTGDRKRRFGRLAYIWTALTRLAGFQPRRFTLTVDGSSTRPKASQILVANCGTLGHRSFRWGPDIRTDDGRLDVCVIRARTLLDFLALSWHFVRRQHRQSAKVHYIPARRSVTIATAKPMPVQADGEIVGQTPVTVNIAAAAIRVAVPTAAISP